MQIEIKGKAREPKFNKVGFIRRLDDVYKTTQKGIEFGFGITFARVYLEQYSVPALANVLRCALFQEKDVTLGDIDQFIESVDADELDELFEEVQLEMGKSPIVKATMRRMEKLEKKGKEVESPEDQEEQPTEM